MGTDEAELKGEKVYHVGEGGYWEAVFWGCSGVTMLCAEAASAHLTRMSVGDAIGKTFLILLSVLAVAIGVGAVAYSVVCVMRVRNAAVILTESGLTVRNWRKAERFIAWEDVVGVVYPDLLFLYSALSLELQRAEGKQRQQLIAMSFGGEVLDNLRDAIVEHLGFAELPQTAKGLLADRDRIWRSRGRNAAPTE